MHDNYICTIHYLEFEKLVSSADISWTLKHSYGALSAKSRLKFIGHVDDVHHNLHDQEGTMDGVSSNDVSHLSGPGPTSDVGNILCSHALNVASHLLMCYAMKLTDPNMLVCTTISYKSCL